MARWQGVVIAVAVLSTTTAAGGFAEQVQETQDVALAMQKVHQILSVECFNNCWTIMDKPDRSPDDVENMLLLAYASLWHWKQRQDCKPLNLSIGYWQVSRAHSLARQYEMAKLFGEKCLRISLDNKLPSFYVGYAHEALARAEVLHKDFGLARKHLADARRQLDEVVDEEEVELLKADILQLEAAISESMADPVSFLILSSCFVRTTVGDCANTTRGVSTATSLIAQPILRK